MKRKFTMMGMILCLVALVASLAKPTFAQTNKVRFTADQDKSPMGKVVAYVKVDIGDGSVPRVLVEIPNGSPKYTPLQRAQIIAKELQRINDTENGKWWNGLSRAFKNNEYVVAHKDAQRGYVLTADKEWAARWGQSPVKYPKVLIDRIKNRLDPDVRKDIIIRPNIELAPKDLFDKALDQRQFGEDNLNAGKPDMASMNFQKAVELAPDYIYAWQCLYQVYVSTNNPKAANVKARIEALKPAVQDRIDGDVYGDAAEELEKTDPAAAKAKWAEAEKLYRSAMQKDPECITFYLYVAEALKRQGKDAEYKNVLQDALDKFNKPEGKMPEWRADSIRDKLGQPRTGTYDSKQAYAYYGK